MKTIALNGRPFIMNTHPLLVSAGARLRRVLTSVLLFGLAFGAGGPAARAADANPPDRMTYQGFLADANGAPLAPTTPVNYDVVFRIYSDQTGGTLIWAEKQTVTVDKGQFSVVLGEGSQNASEVRPALNTVFGSATASDRYLDLTVTVGTTALNIAPRLRLVTSPYAFLASRVSGAGVIAASNLEPALANGLWTVSGANVYRPGGNVGIGTASPGYTLHVNGSIGSASLVTGQINSDQPRFRGAWRETSIGGAYIQWNNQSLGGSGATFLLNQKEGGHGGIFLGELANSGSGVITPSLFTAPGSTRVYGNLTSDGRIFSGGPGSGGIWVDGGNGQFVGSMDGTRMGLYNGSAWRVLVASSGNVGIGGEPRSDARLRIVTEPSNHGSGSVIIEPEGLAGFNSHIHYGNNGDWYIRSAKAAGQVILQDTGGNVGIGTGAPTQGTLVVAGARGGRSGNTYYLNGTGGVFGPDGSPRNFDIYAANYIGCGNAIMAYSDARIKNIKGRSDSTRDLGTLMSIEVSDYTFKDTIAKDSRPHKKVIAQQVETVYPQAVMQSTDVVPDVYQKARIKDGWIHLATDLMVGDRVKLMSGEEEGIHVVLEVKADGFRTGFKPKGDRVFVYGREVKDFRSVDYEAISMLNVSATQELARRLAKVEQRESNLSALEEKAARVEKLERELAELKLLVGRMAAQRPAERPAAEAGPTSVNPAAQQ